jgi:hypothetical protein
LGISNRIVIVDDVLLKSRADLLRQIVNSFVLRWLDGHQVELIDLAEESVSIPFFLDKRSKGLWESAVRHGAGSSYNALAETALFYYFDRQDQQAAKVRQRMERLQSALRTPRPQDLIAL